jgi:N-formylglutamate amidohydrolase
MHIIAASFKNKVLNNSHSSRKFTSELATEERPVMVFFVQDDSAGKQIFWEVIVSVIVKKKCSYEHVSNLEWSGDTAV